jgi:hypothetical protein
MLPVLLFLRVGIEILQDEKNNKTPIWRWQLPPTPISSSIQLSAKTPFAVRFIITYWNLLQKGVWPIVAFIKKVGSRQMAVKAFLDAAVSDDMMLDWWIPDKDWVRHIQENGETDCSIMNLNTGLALQCVWQNDHATLQGWTVFYNIKKIWTSKTIARANKNIRFYYVLGAGKPAPTVPSDQASTNRFGTP